MPISEEPPVDGPEPLRAAVFGLDRPAASERFAVSPRRRAVLSDLVGTLRRFRFFAESDFGMFSGQSVSSSLRSRLG